MKVKVFESNQKGKVEFTRAELEKLLNEIYMDGYREGETHARSNTWTWTTPYSNYADHMKTAITSDSTSNNTISTSSKDRADTAPAITATSLGTTPIEDAKDFIAKLAKELNF